MIVCEYRRLTCWLWVVIPGLVGLKQPRSQATATSSATLGGYSRISWIETLSRPCRRRYLGKLWVVIPGLVGLKREKTASAKAARTPLGGYSRISWIETRDAVSRSRFPASFGWLFQD